MADDAVRHGLDNDPNNDPEKGAVLGGVGGAAVGAAAGAMAGPVGAIVGGVIGAAVGAGASGLAVAKVDQMDNDNTVTGLGKDATTSATDEDMAGYPGDATGYKGGATGDDLTGTTMGEDLSTDDLETGDLTGSTMDPDTGSSTFSDWERPAGTKGGSVDRGLEDTMWDDTSDVDLESDVDEADIKRRVPPSTEPGVWP